MTQATLFEETKEEYLFVLSPPASLKIKIKEIRQKLLRLIGSANDDLIPHITLYYKEFEGDYRNMMIRKAEEILQNLPAFEVELSEWLLFENKHREEKYVVLKVKDPVPVKQLTTLFSKKMKKAFQNNTPHLTLLKGLSPASAQRLIPILEDVKFNMRFTCDKITLLRREFQGEKWTGYDLVREFPLI